MPETLTVASWYSCRERYNGYCVCLGVSILLCLYELMSKHVVKIVLVSKFGVQHLEEEADSLTRSVDPRTSLSPLVQAYQVTQSAKNSYNLLVGVSNVGRFIHLWTHMPI